MAASARSTLCPLLSDICPIRAGAAWLLKRAQLAQELLLDLPGDNAELQATLKALMHVPAGFVSLTSLAFRAPDRIEEAQESVIMAVSWLVGQAKGLVFLSIDRVSLPHLPLLAHIRHLHGCLRWKLLEFGPCVSNAGNPAETSA